MNPGKVVDPYRIDENLRLSVPTKRKTDATHFAFVQDSGDFSQAVERCVGVGKCRRAAGQGEQDTNVPEFYGDARGKTFHARPGTSTLGNDTR